MLAAHQAHRWLCRMAGSSPPDGDSESAVLLVSAGSQALSEPLFKRVCWHVLPVLWLGYVANIVDRTNLGYAQLQMSKDLSLSPRAFGMASGLFFVAYAVTQVPFNHLMLHIGSRRILACSMVAWGCISTATSLVVGERSWRERDTAAREYRGASECMVTLPS